MEWKNWAGNVTANPALLCTAETESDLIRTVLTARNDGRSIRAVGTGHSFAPICATDGISVSLVDESNVRSLENQIATFWAGTKIGTAAAALWNNGCCFQNQGDIDVQSLAGAIGTGTHGTGLQFGSFSERTRRQRIILADGEVLEVDSERDPELLRATALSVGLFGLISEVDIQVAPQHYLREETRIEEVESCFENFTDFSRSHRNAEFYWVPGFDQCVVKTIDITDAGDLVEPDAGELPPPGTIERYLRPARANRAHLVYRNIRTVPFLELEYCVPIDVGMDCVREIRELMKQHFPDKTWVVEYRTQDEDNLMLSPAFGRPVASISVHDGPSAAHSEEYFRACEDIFVAFNGRPHWGKLCFLPPQRRAELFPEFESFSEVRRRLDPDGMFLNEHLRPLFK